MRVADITITLIAVPDVPLPKNKGVCQAVFSHTNIDVETDIDAARNALFCVAFI